MARHYMQVMVGNEVMEIPAPAVDITSGTDRFSTSGQYLSGGAYVRRSRFGARHVEVSWNNLNSQDVYLLHKFEEAVIANDNQFMFVDPFGHGNIMPQWLSNHNMKILPGGGFVKGYSLVPVSSMLQHYEVPENTSGHYDFFIPTGYVGYLWADTLYGALDYTVDDLPVGTGLTLGAGPHQLGVGESGNPTSVTNLFANPDFAATSGNVVVWENLARNPRAVSSAPGWTVEAGGGEATLTTHSSWGSIQEPFKQATWTQEATSTPAARFAVAANNATQIPVEDEEQIAVSIWVATNESAHLAVEFYDSNGIWINANSHSPQISPGVGEPQRITHVAQIPVDAANVRVFVHISEAKVGSRLIVGGFMVGDAPFYFDETFSPDPDLWAEPRPGGGAQLVGKRVAGVSNTAGGVVIQSAQWSRSGEYSLRIIKTNNEAAMAYIPSSAIPSEVKGGTVWRYQPKELTTTNSWFQRVGWDGARTEPATQTEELMRVERDGATGHFYLSGHFAEVGGSVWYDLLTLVDTENYDGPPFSGETTYAPVASATWTGVPDNSPSVLTLHGGGLGGVWCKLVPQGQNPAPLEKLPGRGVSELSFTGEGIDIVQHSAALDLQTAAATWVETGWWK